MILSRCSPGYYGDPRVPGGKCQQCQCNPNGSLHYHCDHTSGQCVCKQGVTGQLCDQCDSRHTLVENECVCKWFIFPFSFCFLSWSLPGMGTKCCLVLFSL